MFQQRFHSPDPGLKIGVKGGPVVVASAKPMN